MCGIVGFVPKKNKEINPHTLMFLGVANEERGTDSCGIAVEGSVKKSVGKARDFFVEVLPTLLKLRKERKLKSSRVIFHTRKASLPGKVSEDTAHPFLWSKEEGRFFVGAHNGKVTDTFRMSSDYIKGPRGLTQAWNLYPVDSQFILDSLNLNPDKTKDILESYSGDAALIWMDEDNFYVWKGGQNDLEERPMYFGEKPEGYYFCSIESSLILAGVKEIKEIENNCLITIDKDCNFTKEIIERKRDYFSSHNYNHWKSPDKKTTIDYEDLEDRYVYEKEEKTILSEVKHKNFSTSLRLKNDTLVYLNKFNKPLEGYFLFDTEAKKIFQVNFNLVDKLEEELIALYVKNDYKEEIIKYKLIKFINGIPIDTNLLIKSDLIILDNLIRKKDQIDDFTIEELRTLSNCLLSPIAMVEKNNVVKVYYSDYSLLFYQNSCITNIKALYPGKEVVECLSLMGSMKIQLNKNKIRRLY